MAINNNAININAGFELGSKQPLDSRQYLTKEQMLNINENIMPDAYFCICKNDGNIYTYNKDNEIDPEIGKFRPVNSDVNEKKAIELTKSAYEQLVIDGLVEEDQNYIIIDDEAPNIIDDTLSSYDNVYSAAHTLGLINTLKENVYTKSETESVINRKLISAIKYKGKVTEAENLPSLAENGDAYYVTGESLLYIYNEDLANYEALGDIVDLSAYLTEEEILELLKEKNIKFQYSAMPEASSEFDYPIQYIGATNENYKLGSWYRSNNNSGTYVWEELLIEGKNKDPFETDAIPEAAENGTTHLYIGTDNANYKKGHVYQYDNSSWNDITAGTIQLKALPTANENELNKIYQYIGVSNSNYTNGYFYKCVESSDSYAWTEIDVQKNNDVPHWTGTHAEYETQKDAIPDYAILHFTDDYDDNLGMPIKDVSSAAGITTFTLREFVKGMLDDIAMQTWENGSYAGKLASTHAGGGDFGSWIGSYQCTKSHNGQYGTTVFGIANNKGFTAIWTGGTIGWDVKLSGYQQKFDEWTNLGGYQGSTLTIPANSASWIKIVGAYIDLGKDTFVPRFFANDIVITNWSIDPADSTLIVLCRNFSTVAITLSKVWLTVIRN